MINDNLSYATRFFTHAKSDVTKLKECSLIQILRGCTKFHPAFCADNFYDICRKYNNPHPTVIYNLYSNYFTSFGHSFSFKPDDEIIFYPENGQYDEIYREIATAIKHKMPIMYPFITSDGIFRGKKSNIKTGCSVLIVDLDSKKPIQYIKRDFKKFCASFPNCIAVFPSFSGKTHIAFYVDEVEMTEEQKLDGWEKISMCDKGGEMYLDTFNIMYNLYVCQLIEFFASEYGYDALSDGDCIDFHNSLCTQGMGLSYISEDMLFINDDVRPYNEILKDKDILFKKYAKHINVKEKKYMDDGYRSITMFNDCVFDKSESNIKINREFSIGGWNGDDVRQRVASGLLYLLGDADKAIEVVRNKLEEKSGNETIAYINSFKREKQMPPSKAILDFCNTLIGFEFKYDEVINLDGEKQWLSDYTEEIVYHLDFENRPVYIKGGCGIGKSTFYQKLLLEHKNVAVIVHLRSVRDGVYSKEKFARAVANCIDPEVYNYVLMPDTAKHIIKTKDYTLFKSKFRSFVATWDTYNILLKDEYLCGLLSEYIKCFDECHNLINQWSFRGKVISDLINKLDNKSIYCTATPLGEELLIPNLYKIEIEKKSSKTVNYYLLEPDFDLNSSPETIGKINTVETIYNLVYNLYNIKDIDGTDYYQKFTIYDNVKHKHLAERYGDQAFHYSRIEKNNADKTRIVCDDAAVEKARKEVEKHNASLNMNDPVDRLKYRKWDEEEYRKSFDIMKSEVDRLLLDNVIDKKIWIPTTAGNEGIEIKMKLKRIAIIFCINGSVTKGEVEQLVNRWREVLNVDVYFVLTQGCHKVKNDETQYAQLADTLLDNIKSKNLSNELRDENWLIQNDLCIDNTFLTNDNYTMIGKFCIAYHNMRIKDTLTYSNLKFFYPELKMYKGAGYKLNDDEHKATKIVHNRVREIGNDFDKLSGSFDVYDEGKAVFDEIGHIEKRKFIYIDDSEEDVLAEIHHIGKESLKTTIENLENMKINVDEVNYLYSVLSDICFLYEECRPIIWNYSVRDKARGGFTYETMKPGEKPWSKDCYTIARIIIKMFTYCTVDDNGEVKERTIKWSALRQFLSRRKKLVKNVYGGTYLQNVDAEKMGEKVQAVWTNRGFDFKDDYTSTFYDLYKVLNDWDNDYDFVSYKGIGIKKVRNKTVVTKSRANLKFALIDDDNVKFLCKKDAYDYLVKEGVVTSGFSTFERVTYKKYIKKI